MPYIEYCAALGIFFADELARIIDPSLYEGFSDVNMNVPATRELMAQVLFDLLRGTPKAVTPIHDPVDGTVAWQYQDATKNDGSPSRLLWERVGLDSIDDIPLE